MSIGRVLLYLANEADTMKWAKDQRAILKGMQRDVQSLSDHATYISTKIQFLLDAMLGVVSIEQNNIIKIFSVAAVALMPRPDFTFVLLADAETLTKRKGEIPADAIGGLLERYEDFVRRNASGKRVVRVDATRPVEEVVREITATVKAATRARTAV